MLWILKKLGNVFGFILIVLFVLAVGWLVDFLILSRVGLGEVPFLGAVVTALLFGVLGWLIEKYFPDDEDED